MGKIALVGGSGFIGSHTADLLRRLGKDYIILDQQSPRDKKHPYQYCNIMDIRRVRECLKGIDTVYMLAAISNSHECRKSPLWALKTNVDGLTHVLDASVECNVSQFIFASSVWVYSTADEKKVNEETCLCANRSKHIYTTSKIAGEMLIRSYGINHTILRYGIAYGPGANNETALSSFLTKVQNNNSITIFGDGEQYRSFMYVTDHARGNIAVLENDKALNQTINLCPEENTSLNDIVQKIKDKNYTFDVDYVDPIANDYRGKDVSNTKARELLKWSPKITFDEGFDLYHDHVS